MATATTRQRSAAPDMGNAALMPTKSFSAEPVSRLGPPLETLSPRAREVLDALEDVYMSEGFAAITLTELTARFKCSRRTLYELAPDRQHLIMFVVDRRYRRLAKLAKERLSELSDPRDKLHTLLTVEMLAMRLGSPAFRRDQAGNPAVRELVNAHVRLGVQMMASVLEEGIASGVFRALDATLIAELIDAAGHRIREPDLDGNQDLEVEHRVLEMAAFIEAGVRA
jgi:AcrR family transcriptional regulator